MATTPHADSVHLAAWNLNHRTGKKAIPPAVIHAIAALDIDVLVLTEFVDGEHHARFKDSLRDIGFESLAVSLKAPRQNQVLIAARSPLADDGGLPLPGHTEASTTNWLHRRLPAWHLEVVGFRAPMYLDADDRLAYWQQVDAIARSARDRHLIFSGISAATRTRRPDWVTRCSRASLPTATHSLNPRATGATTPATAAVTAAPASTTRSPAPPSPSPTPATSTRPDATRSPGPAAVRPATPSPTTPCCQSDCRAPPTRATQSLAPRQRARPLPVRTWHEC